MTVADGVIGHTSCQQLHNNHRVRHGLCGRQMGRSHAHTHQHYFLWNPDQPIPHEIGFRCHSTEADKELGSMDTMVHHRQYECLHGGQGRSTMGEDLREAILRRLVPPRLLPRREIQRRFQGRWQCLQHHHGLYTRCLPLGHHMEPRHAQSGKGWALRCYESGTLLLVQSQNTITNFRIGNVGRSRFRCTYRLERRRQREGRVVLLAQRALQHLVFL